MEFIGLRDVRVTDPFFARVMRIVKEQMIPYQWEIMNDRVPDAEPSYTIHNFRVAAGEVQGERQGVVFLDSDLYKWLEAVAYSLIVFPDPELESLADEVIALIGRAQQADGYLNTYYTLVKPQERWSNLLEGHELYCAGHMIEAAVAYHQATGKRVFLDIVCRFADCIDRTFGDGPGQCQGYPGHPEIELALYRLAEETGDMRYADLAGYFLDARGQGENYFEREKRRPGHRFIFPEMATFAPDYSQSHKPVREQRVATGHAVRAVYLYSAMADAARRTGEPAMIDACRALYDDIVSRQMYITGAIGSAAYGERFTSDYDLPNHTVYGETCAAIGLMMLSARMFLLTGGAGCFAVWERALRNAVLAGMRQDGRRFFYVNPLQIDPKQLKWDPTRGHVKPERQPWFGVACCPPNIARTALSIGGRLFARQGGDLYILAHIPAEAALPDGGVSLTRDGETYRLTLTGAARSCYVRLPENADTSLTGAGGGWAKLDHPGGGHTFTYTIRERAALFRAHPLVCADAGRVAIVEGDLVYCLEEIDNGGNLCAVCVDADTSFERVPMDFLPDGMHGLRFPGYRLSQAGWDGALYAPRRAAYEPCTLIAVPYSQWNNRGVGEMAVWLNVRNNEREDVCSCNKRA